MSRLKDLIEELCPNGVEYKKLWEVTIWDKKFNGISKEKQPSTISYKYYLSSEFDKVEDEKGSRIGKIIDYTLSLADFSVQQLIVKRPFLKSLNDPALTIHRSQIVAINDNTITIRCEKEEAPQKRAERTENFVPNYINPFRD